MLQNINLKQFLHYFTDYIKITILYGQYATEPRWNTAISENVSVYLPQQHAMNESKEFSNALGI